MPTVKHPSEPYEYTQNWVHDMSVIRHSIRVRFKRPIHLLEIGVFEGRFMCEIADTLEQGSVLDGVDPWKIYCGFGPYKTGLPHLDLNSAKDRALRNIEKLNKCGAVKATIIEGRSIDYFHETCFVDYKYDVIRVDGSHNPLDAIYDGLCGWTVLNEGGIMIFDDYGYPKYHLKDTLDPFVHHMDGLKVIHKGTTLIVEKGTNS